MKRPLKVKLEVVKPPANLHFSDSVGQRGVSIYIAKLSEALNSGGAVQIKSDDSYMRFQLRAAAVKLKVKLVYALDGEHLYIKPLAIEGEQKRLMILLREPRTVAELQTKKLELHLENSLADFARQGLAHLHKNNWVLTEKGLDAL